ncbi:hypothetical protein RJT34_30251 [Clitoria ternatea]|uniref:Uncharacterized protein n=1 Tax=Clitoria ternatea TaxID=43366 RepID=A0AAN9I765_CLITE
MRFILEFVSCCGLPTQQPPEPTVARAEEERSLVPAAVVSRRVSRKKHRRTGSADWRPSLGSISEDPTVLPRESPRPGTVAPARRDVNKRSVAGGGGAAKFRYRSYGDGYYGPASVPTIMPTFSPTPFMF